MADMMMFPDTWEEFEESYGFTDKEQIYTNGSRLIPSFRVKQWLEHLESKQRQSDTPQTELTAKCLNCHNAKACKEKHWDGCIYEPQTDCDKCIWSVCNYNKVDWDADTPQNEQMKTADYCDICKQDMCKDCIADASNPYCVPSHYEIKQTEPIADTPQTDRMTEEEIDTMLAKALVGQTDCGWK